MSQDNQTAPQDELLRDLIRAELEDRYSGQYVTRSQVAKMVSEMTGIAIEDIEIEFGDECIVTLIER